MFICGLKLTHDGAVALIEDNRLLFSVEMEKINNNPRYADIDELQKIEDVFNSMGYDLNAVNHFVIDGWGGNDAEALAVQPRLEIGEEFNLLSAENGGNELKLKLARYHEAGLKDDILQESSFEGLDIGKNKFSYSSYYHVTGHVMSAYCSSPFAKRNEASYVLVWDGGMYPRLYYVDPVEKSIKNMGPIFLFIGNIYTIFSQHFGPFKVKGKFAKDDLSIAGKVMAYIAKGEVKPELFDIFDEIYHSHYDKPMGFANLFSNKFKEHAIANNHSDEDILRTFHAYLENMLITKLVKKVSRNKQLTRNLCLVGGCALNIKWNSAIRNSKEFEEVYVPPFPNDSGSAIGMACAKYTDLTGKFALDWNVYTGPQLTEKGIVDGWQQSPCDLELLAKLLYEENEPVVFLNGRAELGPRALGNRSIIANPASSVMKDILNEVKIREKYRPVSPICLEEEAINIFDPGTSDPYMLFDHRVREGWESKIPAIVHLDGTARLQTVSQTDNAVVFELLQHFKKLSGIPMLCNTSANYNGTGFFPDVLTAMKWDRVNYVWSENLLYTRNDKIVFKSGS